MLFDFGSFILTCQIYSALSTNSSNPHPANKGIALTPVSRNRSGCCVAQLHPEVLEEVPGVSSAGGQALALPHSIVAKLLELLLLACGCLQGLEPVRSSPAHLVGLVCT